jgi:Carboxypeptidase regulatory-like domain
MRKCRLALFLHAASFIKGESSVNRAPRSRVIRSTFALTVASSAFLTHADRVAPFTVTGIVLDTNGRPLEGARVRLNADFIYGRVEVTTGADGRYVIRDLIKATYRAQAMVQREYNGATVCQQLAMPSPSDYNSFPVSQGAVKNFRWQLTGKLSNTDEYFGASIMMWMLGLRVESSRAVEFTLTPTGPLFDGRAGSVIVREIPVTGDGYLNDLPLGTYKLKVVLIGKNGSRTPLNIKTRGGDAYLPEIDLVWSAERFCGVGQKSGVAPFFVQVEER